MSARSNFQVSSFISNTYLNYLNGGVDSVEQVGTEDMKIPIFKEDILIDLCDATIDHFQKLDKTLLRIDPPVIVVGDLHGNLHDLLRIWNSIDDIFEEKVLFLGDYVDRGQYQLETITLLFALTLEYSENIYLLRGNHEFPTINISSFKVELLRAGYSENLFDKFNEAFAWMPISAIIGNEIFCVHGGLSPHLKEIEEIESEFQLPINDFSVIHIKKKDSTIQHSSSSTTMPHPAPEESHQLIKSSKSVAKLDTGKVNMQLLVDLMWSDPTNDCENYIASNRGSGCYFGILATHKFLLRNNLKLVVRAHEAIQTGVRLMHDSKCITVFSTSGYRNSNMCGYIKFTNSCADRQSFRLNPIRIIPREEAKFYNPIYKARDPNNIALIPMLSDRVMYSHHSSPQSLSQKLNKFSSLTQVEPNVIQTVQVNVTQNRHSAGVRFNSFSGESSPKHNATMAVTSFKGSPNIVRPLIIAAPMCSMKLKRKRSSSQFFPKHNSDIEQIPA